MTIFFSNNLGLPGGLLPSTHVSDESIVSLESTPTGMRAMPTEVLRQQYQRGLTDGYQAAHKELAAAIQALTKASETCTKEFQQSRPQIERYILSMALEIGAKIARHSLEQPEVLKHAIHEALAQVPSAGAIVVKLNPADLEALRALKGSAWSQNITLVQDPTVTRGGCVLDSPAGRLDARIETQVAQIAQALHGTAVHAERSQAHG